MHKDIALGRHPSDTKPARQCAQHIRRTAVAVLNKQGGGNGLIAQLSFAECALARGIGLFDKRRGGIASQKSRVA